MPKQPSCTYKGRGNSRNFSGEMGFHGNYSHVSWAKWGPCRRFQKILNLSSQPETEATGKRYPLLRKPEFTLAFPVSPYNNKLLLQSQVLPGMAHYPYNKAKPKEHIRKLTGSALWRNNYWELLRTENLPQNKDRLKSIWGLCSIPVDGGERGCELNWQLLRVNLHFLTKTRSYFMFSHIPPQPRGSCSCPRLFKLPPLWRHFCCWGLWGKVSSGTDPAG